MRSTIITFGLSAVLAGFGECHPVRLGQPRPKHYDLTVTRRMCCPARGELEGLPKMPESFFEDWAKLESQMAGATRCVQYLSFSQKLAAGGRRRCTGQTERGCHVYMSRKFVPLEQYEPYDPVPENAECVQLQATFGLTDPFVRRHEVDFITESDKNIQESIAAIFRTKELCRSAASAMWDVVLLEASLSTGSSKKLDLTEVVRIEKACCSVVVPSRDSDLLCSAAGDSNSIKNINAQAKPS